MRAAALQPSPTSETQPDGFAEVLEARLQLSVPPPSTPTGPPMLEHIGAKKKPGTSQLVLDNGDELQLFRRRPWLGEGAHAKVVAGILTTAAVPGQPASRELVAVKKAKLRVMRDGLTSRRSARPLAERTRRHVVQRAVAESSFGLRAHSAAAPARLVVTAKQAYMLMSPMAASLEVALRHLHAASPPTQISWSTWGTYVLDGLLPKVLEGHAQEVVHHDLSLKNVLLRGVSLHVADFGAAQVLGGPHQNVFHGTPWCAAPEALCADASSPASAAANEYFALGMLTLAVAAGPLYGPMLVQSLAYHTATDAGGGLRLAYSLGWRPFYDGDPVPTRALRCHRLFEVLRLAFGQVDEPLRGTLRALMHPQPEQRRHGARLAAGGIGLGDGDLRQIRAELDVVNRQSALSLVERLTGEPGIGVLKDCGEDLVADTSG